MQVTFLEVYFLHAIPHTLTSPNSKCSPTPSSAS
jgi:hypothetical protein